MIVNKRKTFICFLLVICSLLSIYLTSFSSVFAQELETKAYSDVLIDLSKDKTFNQADYTKKENVFSLSVIQIAESKDNELFIYVYQPSADTSILATSINISKNLNNELNYKNYQLKFLNSNGALFKYKVVNFEKEDTTTRFYDISSIFREFIENIDNLENKENGQTISEIAFAVGKIYTFEDLNGELIVSCHHTEIVNITDKIVGFVRYSGAKKPIFLNKYNYCDSHFVAFSTDKVINDLIDADVYFKRQWSSYKDKSGDTEYGNVIEDYVHLDKQQLFVYEDGIYSYERSCIQSLTDFITTEFFSNVYDVGCIRIEDTYNLSNESLTNLSSKQWVLRFYTSDLIRSLSPSTGGVNEEKTSIKDVSILRLKFKSFDNVYNLGVVDNKQTGSDQPMNEVKTNVSFTPWFKTLLIVLIIIVIIALCWPIMPYVANVIVWLLKAIILSLTFVISIPVKLIQKIKQRKSEKENNDVISIDSNLSKNNKSSKKQKW